MKKQGKPQAKITLPFLNQEEIEEIDEAFTKLNKKNADKPHWAPLNRTSFIRNYILAESRTINSGK